VMFTEQGYYVALAEGVKRVAKVPVVGVGLIRDPEYADRIVREGRVDLVAIGRCLLEEPLWGLRAAEQLGVKDSNG
ncbi:MAG: NADH:flavin oxidoreductase/NADH oxidase, partial [Dehalococcoidia bacterium]|nr:NADH:flavin oxidoreductase/NADH oxidase [Dehalococcoidia bacterium]